VTTQYIVGQPFVFVGSTFDFLISWPFCPPALCRDLLEVRKACSSFGRVQLGHDLTAPIDCTRAPPFHDMNEHPKRFERMSAQLMAREPSSSPMSLEPMMPTRLLQNLRVRHSQRLRSFETAKHSNPKPH
jgi:hypothetical protein